MPTLSRSHRSYSLSTYLMLIVVLAVLPIFIFSGVIVNRLFETYKYVSQQMLMKAADDLTHAMDQEFSTSIRTLQAVSMSNSLARNDLKTFHDLLIRVLKTQPSWSAILLHNPKTEWLLSTRYPYGTDLGLPPEPASIREVVATGQPIIGHIIKSPPKPTDVPFKYGFAIRVPVKNQQGQIVYVLSAILATDPIQEILNRYTNKSLQWISAVLDQEGVIAARSLDPESTVGHHASPTLRKLIKSGGDGLHRTRTLEGVDVYTTYGKGPVSGWFAAIAVPTTIIEAQATATRRTMLQIGLLILLFLGLVTIYFSRWIRLSIEAGSKGAAALSRGEEPTMAPSRIREMENLRTSLVSASQLLKSRDKAKSEFLANMSHELRTPLGIVLGMTDLISKDGISAEERDKSWEIVKRNGQQLLRLIDDILDFSKVETNRLVIENIDFSLVDLISNVVEDFSAVTEQKQIQLKVVSEPGHPELVNSDPIRLKQIILNLVGNAVKFTDQGFVEVRIHLVENELVRVTVSDTGIGMTDQQKSLLFSKFTQGDSSHTRKYGGTGLGLSFSRELARRLGGDVRLIQTQQNLGSVFELSFKSRLALSALAPDENRAGANAKSGTFVGRSILLAEDSPDNVALLRSYLKSTGLQLTVASNGNEAQKIARTQNFDLILMDIQMPDMDGYEATRLIREAGITTPIIALTAHALAEHRDRALNSGFSDYLTKPIQRKILIQSLQKYLK